MRSLCRFTAISGALSGCGSGVALSGCFAGGVAEPEDVLPPDPEELSPDDDDTGTMKISNLTIEFSTLIAVNPFSVYTELSGCADLSFRLSYV
ncbi:hypothetical protein D3C76_1684570 [compost metagenome]